MRQSTAAKRLWINCECNVSEYGSVGDADTYICDIASRTEQMTPLALRKDSVHEALLRRVACGLRTQFARFGIVLRGLGRLNQRQCLAALGIATLARLAQPHRGRSMAFA